MADELLSPLSILIVEDHADSAQTLAEVLSLYGHEVHLASSGIDALREVVSHPPDVVLLDIGLPGMNGWELAGCLKSLPKPPVLIAVTGYAQVEDRRRSEDAGIHLHLAKPVDPAILSGLLKRVAEAVRSVS